MKKERLSISSKGKNKKTPTPYTKKSASKTKSKQSALMVMNNQIVRETPVKLPEAEQSES